MLASLRRSIHSPSLAKRPFSAAAAASSSSSSSTSEHIVDFSGLLRPPLEEPKPAQSKYAVIEAISRTEDAAGSRASRRLRGAGFIPGVFYGHDEQGQSIKRLVMVDKKQIVNEFRKRLASFESTVFELKIDGKETQLVTARQLQLNTTNMTPYSVNFLKYKVGSVIRIPIKFINQEKSPIIKKGYLPIRINQFIECECRVDQLPEGVTIDMAGLDGKKTFRVSDIKFPEGVRPLPTISKDKIVAVIKQLK